MPESTPSAFMSALPIVGQAAGAIYDIASQNSRNEKAYHMQKRLWDQQDIHQRNMTEFNQANQLETWKATGPVGQMEQLKKAGLNPALIYGMGGAGGQTANSAQAQSAGNPSPQQQTQGQGAMGMGLMLAEQIALLKAQRKNIDADTANKQGQAANQPITGENIQANTALTNVNATIARVQREIQENTKLDQMGAIASAAAKAAEEVNIAENQKTITYEQAQNARQTAAEQLISLQLQNENSRKNLQLTDAQIDQISKQLNINQSQLELNQKIAGYQTIDKILGDQIIKIIETLKGK